MLELELHDDLVDTVLTSLLKELATTGPVPAERHYPQADSQTAAHLVLQLLPLAAGTSDADPVAAVARDPRRTTSVSQEQHAFSGKPCPA